MHYRERRCPHCGRTNGLYTKNTYRNVRDFYDFQGNMVEENLDDAHKEVGKRFYCEVCGKIVCKNEEEYNQMYGNQTGKNLGARRRTDGEINENVQ